MRNGVLILECLDKADPGSEGQFLLHMFHLMHVNVQYVETRTKRQLLSLMDRPPFRLLHITTHGSIDQSGSGHKPSFCGLWSPTQDIAASDLAQLKGKLRGRSVITTACMSGTPNFAKRFVRETGCEYYVAPRKSPTYATAIYFSHLLYHKYFRFSDRYGRDIPKIVADFDERHKNVADFRVLARQP